MRKRFICPRETCGAVSFNKNDIKYKYCGRCHTFAEDVIASEKALQEDQVDSV